MKPLSIVNVIVLALGCTTLAFSGPHNATVAIVGHAGPGFVFTPTDDPYDFKAAVNGVAKISLLGNCTDHADLDVRFPATPGQTVLVNGSGTFTSVDGTATLNFTLTGSATPDPANPAFFNSKYQLKFTGGSGAMASAKGLAEIEEVIMLTSPLTGSASWVLQGIVTTPR